MVFFQVISIFSFFSVYTALRWLRDRETADGKPSREHEMLVEGFRKSEAVAELTKNCQVKNGAELVVQLLMKVFKAVSANYKDRFGYVHCLLLDDQIVFMTQYFAKLYEKIKEKQMLPEQAMACVAGGGIQLSMWIEIMDLCTRKRLFKGNYSLHRRAYWGENEKVFSDATLLSSYHCLVRAFENGRSVQVEKQDIGSEENQIQILFDGFSRLTREKSLNPSQNNDPHRELRTSAMVY
jgi:hypothetical protein